MPWALARVIKTRLFRTTGRADYKRWKDPVNLQAWWDARTQQLAQLVPPGSRVLEFGAGRCRLRDFLTSDCSYTPSDLVDRGPGTLVCDLNQRPLPDLSGSAADVVVFGGVLEYIRDVPELIRWLADSGVQTCVASFDAAPANGGVFNRFREMLRRSYYGYMNGLSKPDLQQIFERAGYACETQQTWTTQGIYRFVRKS
jgi:hypothetical protein